MKSKNSAISVKDVTKIYRLYEKPIDRLKEAMSITHKNFHRDFYALNGISFDVNKGFVMSEASVVSNPISSWAIS